MRNLWDAQTALNAERLESLTSEHMAKEVVQTLKYKAERGQEGGGADVGRVHGDYT